MINKAVTFLLIIGLSLGLGLLSPSPSLALVEIGAGFTNTSFEDDLDFVDTDSGTSLELNIGSGSVRLMAALQSSSHNQGDYDAWMVGPSFTLDVEGFIPRIYVLLSGHEFESIDGTGITLGGGVGWPIFSGASFALDLRVSQWEGNGGIDVGTGTLQILLRVGF
jgi:hypothetical protein